MNFFEEQFRKMLWGSDMIQSPFYVDGVCFGVWENHYLVQMEFIAPDADKEEEFDMLEIVAVHRTSGQQNTFTVSLKDVLGGKIIYAGFLKASITDWAEVETNCKISYCPTWKDWNLLRGAVRSCLESLYKPEVQPVSDHRLVYICAPLRGDVEQNIEYARQRAREVFQAGNIPVCPHLMFPPVADPGDPVEDQTAREMGLRLVTLCQQVNVYGTCTAGMQEEIKLAARHGIPVQYLGKEASGHVE